MRIFPERNCRKSANASICRRKPPEKPRMRIFTPPRPSHIETKSRPETMRRGREPNSSPARSRGKSALREFARHANLEPIRAACARHANLELIRAASARHANLELIRAASARHADIEPIRAAGTRQTGIKPIRAAGTRQTGIKPTRAASA